jgi:hypothetical protein
MATVSILFSTFGICVAVVSSSTNWKVTHKVLGFDSQMSSVQNPLPIHQKLGWLRGIPSSQIMRILSYSIGKYNRQTSP